MGDCIRKTYRAEGLGGFFRGLFPPLVTVSVIKSVSFSVYMDSKQFFREHFHLDDAAKFLDLAIVSSLAGLVAGSIVSVISCPLEIVKIQRQLEALLERKGGAQGAKGTSGSGIGGAAGAVRMGLRDRLLAPLLQRSGSLAVGLDIVKVRGISGLYRGFYLHLARDSIGTAIYFCTYESVKRYLAKDGEGAGPATHLIAGALCGVASWVFVFPIDLVKSVTQKDVLTEAGKKPVTAYQIARSIWRTAGITGLYSGFSSTLARAVPIHSLNWIVYEAVLEKLESL
ncbi:hypothetical protein HDU96_007844 [Phlyctochytrium bullatum]|nr:hypothetical protein HDU96_007844 [Phlyctochytrium bullatum]